tara:strand:- start:445 stop:1047 length:603 start_codon:yes stop_codon:yes gene_type:complete
MIIVRHRRNTDEELAEISTNHGAEIDIRSQGEHLVLHHEPYQDGKRFDTWLENYDHAILILNVKEEGLEGRVLELMAKKGIDDFFFLDQSFPFLVKTSRTGESRCAVRVSEFENINTAMSLAGKVDWVWIDCFTRFPLDRNSATRLKEAGFKLCVVSPELQGRMQQSDTDEIVAAMNDAGVVPDAVCTKFPERWEEKSDN